MQFRKALIYTAGLLSGAGIVAASISGAADSLIPYEFKDGQVISADTLNDLFAQLKQGSQGYNSESELNGVWSCITYDSSDPSTRTSGMPNMNFEPNSTSGTLSVTQTWTFTNSGNDLTMDKVRLGGVSENNTGVCGTASTFSYKARVVESTLMLTGNSSCTTGTGKTFGLVKVSPYKFRATLSPTVIACVATVQPPNTPSNLSALSSAEGVRLSWQDNGGSPSTFNILKKIDGIYSPIGSVPAGTNSFLDTSGTNGSLYRVQATNGNGTSLSSAAALASN